MADWFSKFVSYVFHPLLMPTYTLVLIFNINMYFSSILPFYAKLLLIIMVLSSTVFIPVIIFSVLKKKKIINSFQMESREERVYPYLVISIIYFLIYLLIKKTNIPDIYSFFLICSTALSLLLLMINFKYKISAHTAGMGGVCGLFIGLSNRLDLDLSLLIIILIAFSGLVAFSRLKLNAHKSSEVYSGFLAGVAVFLLFTLLI